jgi:tripartite ATP-independent transporter DctM subunit
MGQWLALVMFGIFMVLIVVGYPVAFSFALTGAVFMVIGLETDEIRLNSMKAVGSNWWSYVTGSQGQTLLAVPFFVFMGAIFEKSGQAERLLVACGRLMGPLRGGVALTVVAVGTMLAAATGVVAATVIMMGMISLPAMIRYGYDHRLATGVIVASGTLAQLIPPSLVLLVLASNSKDVTVGELFRGAMVPGLLLAGLYALYVVYVAITSPEKAPALPLEERRLFKGRQLAKESVIAIVPPILLILCVLGAIFQGIATPSEVGSVGAVVACLLALFNGRLTWSVISNASRSTANITGLVMMMLFASNFFSKVFQELGGQNLIEDWLSDVPGGKWGFIIIANIAVFLLGVNLEFLEISFIVMPLFVPVAAELGIDPVWFMVTLAVNLNIAFISPPVGFSLFYLQSVKPPEVKTIDIHKGALPFCALQIVALVICIAVPGVVTWLVDSENVDWGVLGNSTGRLITIAVLIAVALWFFVRPALARHREQPV